MTDTEAPGIGHNSDAIGEAMEKADLILSSYARLPTTPLTLDEAQRAVALVKQLRIIGERIEAARKDECKPHAVAIAAVKVRTSKTEGEVFNAMVRANGLVHAARIRLGLQTITSDFGPKAYGKKSTHLSVEPANLPDEYWEPNMDKIKADLKAGKGIAGVTEIEEEITVIS